MNVDACGAAVSMVERTFPGEVDALRRLAPEPDEVVVALTPITEFSTSGSTCLLAITTHRLVLARKRRLGRVSTESFPHGAASVRVEMLQEEPLLGVERLRFICKSGWTQPIVDFVTYCTGVTTAQAQAEEARARFDQLH